MECLMKEPFKLQHVVLYAKGWYKRTENLYADLGLMLELDGYPGYENDRAGIMNKLLKHWMSWSEWYNSLFPANYTGKTLEKLITTDASFLYRRYRKNSPYEAQNFTDYYDVLIMAILIDWSQSDVKYMNIECPIYTKEVLPNDSGLFSQSEWYREAKNKGIKSISSLVKFFNKKAQQCWEKTY